MKHPTIHLENQKIGRLTVLRRVTIGNKTDNWECICDCGNLKTTKTSSLKFGTVLSCGCLVRDTISKHLESGVKGGRKPTKEYSIWGGMNRRCNAKRGKEYKNYGAKNIKVCERWKNSFELFLEDMGRCPSPLHSLDRYPNKKGDYEPNNCRWATLEEQNNNKTNNVNVEYFGQIKTATQWSRYLGRNADYVGSYLKKIVRLDI